MATYVIGDLQGSYDALLALLARIQYEPAVDTLWFAGDLVNRGPQSLQSLRFVMGLGDRAISVLGNHDLHLLATAAGARKGKRDTLDDILQAPDRDELLDWLRHRPLMHVSSDQRFAMLHAGLPPQWSISQAADCAVEVEAILKNDPAGNFLKLMYGDKPDLWDEHLSGLPRLRYIVNCFTRLRYCSVNGQLEFHQKGRPGTQPKTLMPWFMVPERRSLGTTILFGHWSTLGKVHWPEHGVYGLDTGCIWGGQLTALRLEDQTLSSVECERVSEFD